LSRKKSKNSKILSLNLLATIYGDHTRMGGNPSFGLNDSREIVEKNGLTAV